MNRKKRFTLLWNNTKILGLFSINLASIRGQSEAKTRGITLNSKSQKYS